MATGAQTIRLRTAYMPALKLRKQAASEISEVRMSSHEDNASTLDSLSHAIRLYTALRELWREGSRAESGVCYVKVNGEFVKVSIARPRQ